MIDSGTRNPIPFDPAAAELPEGMLLPPRRGGEVVALIVDPGMGMAGWSLRVGRSLARAWARQERRVVLVDAHVEEPALHQLLGVSNSEGITDAIEYGVSRGRVTHRPDGEPFEFVSAGTVLPHHLEFWRSRRWGSLLQGYREDDRVVLLYLPGGAPDVGAIVRSADRSFWVGRPDAPDLSRYPGIQVLASPSQADGAPVRRTSDEVDERFRSPQGLTGAAQSSLAPKPEAGRTLGKPAGPHGSGDPPPRAPRSEGSTTGARPVGGRRSMPWLLLLGVLLLAGGVIGHWFGVFTIPGLPVRLDPGATSLIPHIFGAG
ncbi:MAG: hypothetical protein EA351_10225 [Gemmatimonadales bacterium]|nr:MAG: hypothetical protein EA351_10225 [Gemmatimonadales bacterium]